MLNLSFEADQSYSELVQDVEFLFARAKQIVPAIKAHPFGLVTCNLVNSEAIAELNKHHRDKHKPTDVLSFSFVDGLDVKDPNPLLGEIMICIEVAQQQAQEKGHSFEYECKVLFTHGLLHVFGFDHNTDEEEEEMESWAQKILQS